MYITIQSLTIYICVMFDELTTTLLFLSFCNLDRDWTALHPLYVRVEGEFAQFMVCNETAEWHVSIHSGIATPTVHGFSCHY